MINLTAHLGGDRANSDIGEQAIKQICGEQPTDSAIAEIFTKNALLLKSNPTSLFQSHQPN